MQRSDDFAQRHAHLSDLSDEELHQRFWDLAARIVKPMVDLARKHTSPSIERSVLLRMGFSSNEAKEIVNHCQENNLLAKGAGHAVWRYAQMANLSYREAGLRLGQGQGWEDLKSFWPGGNV